MVATLAQICANAITPDQLLPYVGAVSGLKSRICGQCLLHYGCGQAVLVAYPVNEPLNFAAMNASVSLALEMQDLENLTVISARRPDLAPENAAMTADQYWALPLPATAGAKLRNMLKRAAREVEIERASGAGAWTMEHSALMENFCGRKVGSLAEGSRFLFGRMDSYLASVQDAALFSARRADGSLAACAIGDFTAMGTAFYMFAFRFQDAPPGAADLLLDALAREGEARGHRILNLGLGIDQGVEFFKKKWGAEPFLPFVETSWRPQKARKSFWARFLGR